MPDLSDENNSIARVASLSHEYHARDHARRFVLAKTNTCEIQQDHKSRIIFLDNVMSTYSKLSFLKVKFLSESFLTCVEWETCACFSRTMHSGFKFKDATCVLQCCLYGFEPRCNHRPHSHHVPGFEHVFYF